MSNNYQTIDDLAAGRKNNFDFIRFVAASAVLFTHTFPLSGNNDSEPFLLLSNKQTTLGHIAVAVFFIISGFLVSQSYERSSSIMSFTKARILRIFPGLLTVLLLSSFVLGPVATTLPLNEYFKNGQTYQYLKGIFLYPLYWFLPGVFTHNLYSPSVNGSLWTIPTEFLCYIFVGIWGLASFLKYKRANLFLFILSFYMFVLRAAIWPDGGFRILGLPVGDIVNLFVYFSAGMFVYAFRKNIPLDKYFAMISIVVLVFSVFFGGFMEAFVIFGSYLVFYLAFSPAVKLSSFSKYGDFSYGIYLYAFPIQQLVTYYHGGKMSAMGNFLTCYPIVVILAVFSWYTVEKNFLKLKKVPLLIPPIPSLFSQSLHSAFHKLGEMFDALSGYIARLGWTSFALMIVLCVTFLNFYTSQPSVIEFPYNRSSVILHGGWLPQSPDEHYRWVAGSASVDLLQPPKANKLVISGFVPKTFEGLNKLSVYLNGQILKEQNLKYGEEINFASALPKNTEATPKKLNVRLTFNYIHKPEQNDADKRELSALISKISVL